MSRSITPISAKCAGLPAASTRRLPPAAAPSSSIPIMPARSAISASRCSTRASSRGAGALRPRHRARGQFRPGAQQSRQRAATAQALRRRRAGLSPRHRIAAELRRRLEQSRHLPARTKAPGGSRRPSIARRWSFAPNNPDTLDNLALALKDLERLDEAADLMRRALVIESRSDKFICTTPRCCSTSTRSTRRRPRPSARWRSTPNNHDAVNLMGRVAFERGDLDGCARALPARARAQARSRRRL